MENTDLTPEIATKISERIEDRESAEEIRKGCSIQANTFRHWITQSVLLPRQDLDGALLKLRDAILERILKETVILGMLKAAETPSEKITRKHVILSELSKQDKALLERDGHEAFIEQVEGSTILKVEETVEIIPPQTNLFKEVLKAISTGNVEEPHQNLIPFNPPHPDTPEV